MSKIALRAYSKKIEKLIDEGLYDDAVAHSRHILKSYPKCIEAYRNLAKALLEKKEYPEAKDIFLRILSVFPDDFVSHIGLSIISENDGNLDAAIWRMELAYDVQPSNPVLTEELRRLFGRRDGYQPPRIRMSRSALIRMYARGELFSQAISECQSALIDDPKRLDIELILAQMLFQSGALAESAETCAKVLNEIPYCYEANQLMLEILSRTGQTDGAATYRNRLGELDPYFSHITSSVLDSSEVPDNAILLEFMEEDTPAEVPDYPVWSKPVNLSWEENSPIIAITQVAPDQPLVGAISESDTTPLTNSSLSDISDQESESFNETIQKKIEALDRETGALYTPQEIPDWMRNAGWTASNGAVNKELDNSTLSTENVNVGSENAQPADIPDWLQSTGSKSEQTSGTEDASNQSAPENVKEFLSTSAIVEDLSTPLAVINADSTTPTSEVPNLIPEQGETGDMMPSDSINKNEDEWLNQFRDDSSPKGEQNDLPDWLKDFESENEQPLEENMDIPEWLKSLEPVEAEEPGTPEIAPMAEQMPPAETPPEEPEPAITSTSYVFTKVLSESEATKANLETTILQPEPEMPAAEEVAPELPHATAEVKPPAEASSGLPAWVRNILKPHAAPTAPVEVPIESAPAMVDAVPQEVPTPEPLVTPVGQISQEAISPEVPPIPNMEQAPEVPVESGEEPIQELSSIPPTEGAISSETSTELLDWLRGFGENEEQAQAAVPSEEPVDVPEMSAEPVAEEPLERLGSFVETGEAIPPIPEPESIEEMAPVVEETTAPVMEETPQPIAEEIAPIVETSWVEEIPRAIEAEPPVEMPEPQISEEGVPVIEPQATESAEPVPSFVAEAATTVTSEETEIAAVTEQEPVALPVVPDPLSVAQNALAEGDFNLALNEFNMALQDESQIPVLIDALKNATAEHSGNTDLLQLLGDAYARTNQFEEAFSAYDKVESLLLKSS